MADWQAETRRAAERYGLDPDIFVRQIRQESGFNPNARSGAGALGIAQIMPGTAKGWGVDPLNPREALDAAAKNMAAYVQKYGGYENALRAYNAGPGAIEASKRFRETNHYVSTILNGRDPGASPAPSSGKTPSAGGMAGAASSAPASPQLGPSGDYASGLAALLQPEAKPQSSTPLAPPAFMAGLSLPQGFKQIEPTGPAQEAASSQSGLLEALRGAGPASGSSSTLGAADGLPVAQAVMAQRQTRTVAGAMRAGKTQPSKGAFEISGPNPDRLKPELTSFAEKVARVYGGPLVGKDGSTHSKYTVNGNVSQHYTGNATDIFEIDGKPAEGERLLAAGRAALIAAGMPRAKAMKAEGGLYNVGSHQIIFLTNEGGNHFDHLHISSR